MPQTAKIAFTLDTTDAKSQLGFEAWINDYKFYNTKHVTGPERLQVDISDDDANHELRFVLKNKAAEHTQIDKAGNIVADARLKITDIAFDEIPLGHVFTEQTTYVHDFNSTAPPIQDKFYGEMGCNGTVSLKFSTPIYLWLLEHM
jgi:hypothetical protein